MLKQVLQARLLARASDDKDVGQFDRGLEAARRGDFTAAYQLWRPLAELGHAEAQLGLGIMSETGQGAAQDNAEALRWYRLAATVGLAEAQYVLGSIHAEGKIVAQSDREAVRWYRVAAEKGHAQSQYRLGFMYAQGQGVPQRFVQAHMWWSLSAAQGQKTAEKARSILAKLMTPQQIAMSQELAMEWRSRAQ